MRKWARGRKRFPKLPPLGWRDICLYLLALVLTGGCVVLGFGTMFWWRKELTAFLAPEALCTAQTSGIWLFALGGFTMVGLFGCALDCLFWKYPILGAPGVSYGGGEWDPIYPMFLKDPDAPEAVKKAVNTARTKLMLWGVAWVAAALVLVLWAGGGTRLYPDGSVQTTVGFGEVTEHYAVEDIDRVFVTVTYSTGRRRYGTPRDPDLMLKLRTSDNQIIEFCLKDFCIPEGMSELEALESVLENYPEEKRRYENGEYLYLFLGLDRFDGGELDRLEELFGVSEGGCDHGNGT